MSSLNNCKSTVIQITDTHLFEHDSSELFGIKSNLKFQEVIAKIRGLEIDNNTMMVLTGDLSQDETIASYQKLVEHLDGFNVPVYWIPGNHDNLENMQAAFKQAKNFVFRRRLSLPDWEIIFLNTKENGTPKGYLSADELAILKKESTAMGQKKAAIIMHHHPAPVGTPLIDNFILKNRDEFWETIHHSNVGVIICGHVHGDYSFKYNNVLIESSPATCLQWTKGTTKLDIEPKIGFKIHYFAQNHYHSMAELW